MRKSKLIRILKHLTPEEFKEFKKFIHSSFFNRNKKCIELYELLSPYYPHFNSEKIDAPLFTAKIYSNKNSMAAIMEKFIRLLEQYLSYLQYKQKEELQRYFLLEELRERREYKHYNLIHKQAVRTITKKRKDTDTFYYEYLYDVSRLEMDYQQSLSQEKKATQLKKTIYSFNKYLLSNHLWLDNTVLNALDVGSPLVEEITREVISDSKIFINLATQEQYANHLLIQLRLLAHRLLENRQEDNFIQLFQFLKENHIHIGETVNKHFYKFLANFCIDEIHKGNKPYYKKLLNMYIYAMETGALIEGKYLSSMRMKNIIITSVRSEQAELAHSLLNQYINSINPADRAPTQAFYRGYLHFHQKEYNAAINSLENCIKMKSLFDLDSQSILYKIYYETNEDWAFDIPIESFITKLSRYKSIYSKQRIDGYLNFFRILKQIYKKRENTFYKKSIEDINHRINKMKFISDKQWLLEKLGELKDTE